MLVDRLFKKLKNDQMDPRIRADHDVAWRRGDLDHLGRNLFSR